MTNKLKSGENTDSKPAVKRQAYKFKPIHRTNKQLNTGVMANTISSIVLKPFANYESKSHSHNDLLIEPLIDADNSATDRIDGLGTQNLPMFDRMLFNDESSSLKVQL